MPIANLVLELDLEVMFYCLVRQGRVVKEGIGSLHVNLSRIKGMYKEVSMQQQDYCLHTIIVYKGNYWAYQHYR